MKKKTFEIGTRIGFFTVAGESEKRLHNHPTWKIKCDCGTVCLRTSSDMCKLVTTSNCGCKGVQRLKKALCTGNKYGKLRVIEPVESDRHGKQRWLCICDCGVECVKTTSGLRLGKMQSCGCHIYLKHGKSNTKTYSVWEAMKQRCYNTNHKQYEYYGGRGITICPQWLDFTVFLADMGEYPPDMVIDRIDPNGNYNKENCRWTTRSESSYNTRKQKNNTSGRTGVRLDIRDNRWYATIDFQGETIRLGSSLIFEDAVKLRETAELFYFGYNKE